MAPINLPDGSEASTVTMPDGTEASEVRDPDGNVVFSAIPDSEVSRPDDNNVVTNSSKNAGIKFSTSQEWPDFQARISSNTTTASDETMVIGDTNGSDVATLDVSGNSAGDVVTFSDVNLSADTDYSLYLRSSNGRDRGYYDSPSFPYTSTDGNLEIVNGWFEGSTTSNPFMIDKIGNINL